MDNMTDYERELLKDKAAEREFQQERSIAFGRAWRMALVYSILVGLFVTLVGAPIYGGARGCASKPDVCKNMVYIKSAQDIKDYGMSSHCLGKLTTKKLILGDKDFVEATCICKELDKKDGGQD